jgi:hypothetical protein
MKVSIQFQYMPDETRRPVDGADHNEPIRVGDGQFMPIPRVGDTVSYESYRYDYKDNRIVEGSGRVIVVARKVRTVHYSFIADLVSVNIVVTDVPEGELAMRLKE